MENQELRERCKAFRQTLDHAYHTPLDADFLRRFNEFVFDHPHALEWEDDEVGSTPLRRALFHNLWRAIDCKYSLETWKPLVVRTTRRVLAETDDDGWTLLHFACNDDPSALEIISFLAERFPDAAKMKTKRRSTPLHLAFMHHGARPQVPVIRSLVEANPRAVRSCNARGNTPLHLACRSGVSRDAMQYLVTQNPRVCLYRNENGHLPLDLAEKVNSRGAVEFLATATGATSVVLLKRFCFHGLPHENLERVMGFLRHGPVSMVKLVPLARAQIDVFFQRACVRDECHAQIQTITFDDDDESE